MESSTRAASGPRTTGRRSSAARRRAALDEITDKLYAGLPAEFTAARDAAVRTARHTGDTELADAVQRLRRPRASAWLANLLVRERPHAVADLVALGMSLRRAQAAFDGAALRALSDQRHSLVRALSQDARRLAGARGQSLGDTIVRELEGTLEAAVFDPDASEELQRGRLSGPLQYSGIGLPPSPSSTTSSSSPCSGTPSSSSSSSSTGAAREAAGPSPAGPGHRAAARKQEQGSGSGASSEETSTTSRLRKAQREVRDARCAADAAAAVLRDAERASERERAALSAAEEQLARQRRAARDAQRVVVRARADREAAERQARRAEQRAAARREETS